VSGPESERLVFVVVPDAPMGFVAMLEADYIKIARSAPSEGKTIEEMLSDIIHKKEKSVTNANSL
jgi:hypothetical protein